MLATVEPGIKRLLDRRGLGEGDDNGSASGAWADEAPVLAAASATGTVALGPHRGARLRRLGEPSEEGEALAQRIPTGRLGSPDDLVGAAIYLASPASAFMTGQTLIVDGGFSLAR